MALTGRFRVEYILVLNGDMKGYCIRRTLMNQTAVIIPKVRFSEPRRNLPGRRGTTTHEDRFTIAFARAYLRQAPEMHRTAKYDTMALAREVAVNGYGIADMMVVAWQSLPDERFPTAESFVAVARPCARAFECKLTDWRRAMSQATRYVFFAHQAIVVLPETVCVNALPYLDTFRRIRVGLWGYSMATDRISAHYTPRPSKPLSMRWHLHAVQCVASISTQALPISRKG